MAVTKHDEKVVTTHQETLTPSQTLDYDYPVKDVEGANEDLDYSGVQKKKTDPAEIALVKKLDLFIMPTLWVSVAGHATIPPF
jgi:hypothetical protein